ncbi:MAG: 1-(5-phosphoribosyl)-5-[(5-phosphoribosylamino)methylideneamino]imidazole-4-carboxamide isomerase, partial [Chloroflexi bacterium]|nr:1-(5-phosphoribosyl)-5-[(5-phosphoribosylamino)methylideneamino]imidazole-4-carboxamide isomerase [Chloroflexota bacterium]
MPFEVIPAIDLRGGRCVRLFQGDFARETVFSDDPVGVAQRWESLGAPRLHVVDLDGAAQGKPANTAVIERIAQTIRIPIQVGGGLRTLESVDTLVQAGAGRVVLGTAAAEDPALVRQAVERHGERIVVGVDARNGMVATHGWVKQQQMKAIDLVRQMERLGVARFVYTDIAKDGVLAGPSYESTQEVVAATRAAVIASGGVASIEHLQRLAAIGVEGAIVGKALYTGAVDLR